MSSRPAIAAVTNSIAYSSNHMVWPGGSLAEAECACRNLKCGYAQGALLFHYAAVATLAVNQPYHDVARAFWPSRAACRLPVRLWALITQRLQGV